MYLLLAVVILAFAVRLGPPKAVSAQSGGVTAFDLILAMNTLRVSGGLPALIEDPIVMAVAQATAEIMAASEMSWHIGNVRGRIAAAGYGNGGTVWATENFAVGTSMGIDQIMLAWADPDHMRPAVIPAYCHVGAGVAQAASGRIYYVLQAAYTSNNACGPYTYPEGTGAGSGSAAPGVPQIIIPVQVATPDAEGKIYHVVKSGQSYWSIAIAYRVTIADIEFWNNRTRTQTLPVGTVLFIPDKDTEGYATPTPVGMVVPNPPDADGVIVHVVEPYHTLITIGRAYGVAVERILALNGWQKEWPLQIGQQLLISPGSVTPSATLSAIHRLTPAGDGRYYHTVRSGETLSFIAGLYEINTAQLMAWNGLVADSVIFPDQTLVLMVTPPVSATPTPLPPVESPTPTPTQTSAPAPLPTDPMPEPQLRATAAPEAASPPVGLAYGGVLALLGALLLVGVMLRRRSRL
jgi:LysM repeat protein